MTLDRFTIYNGIAFDEIWMHGNKMKSPVVRPTVGMNNSCHNFKLSSLAKPLMCCPAGFDNNASLQVADR